MEKTGIALFAYKRPEHTKRVLEGLKANNIRHLYVFIDGPKREEDRPLVEEVNALVEAVDWCRTQIIRSQNNKGLAESEICGISHVLQRHERIIVLEDDCVPAADFIDFMEQCFDRYQHEPKVMNITGYALPIKILRRYPYDVYFTYRSGSFGQGIWKRSWQFFKKDPQDFHRIENSRELRRKLDRAGRDLYFMFKQQMEGKLDSVGIWWAWSIVKNDGVCVNPVISRIQSIGHDGTGVHCDNTDKYNNKSHQAGLNIKLKFPENLEVNKTINRRFDEFIHGTSWERLRLKGQKLMKLILREKS